MRMLVMPKCMLNPKYYMKRKDYYWYKDGVDKEDAWEEHEEEKEEPVELKTGFSVLRKESKVQPEDWEFMKQSGEVLENIPDTWKQYPNNVNGKASIVDMEYKEMQNATTREDKMHELVHLVSACLYLWRELKSQQK